MKKRHIAVLGTGSDVGKSILGAALCRILADKGEKVAPFKAQNMSNNSGITPEGLEMGRAQIVQAEACRLAPHVHMNPILLKPTGEKQSQVVLNGRVLENQTAMDYHKNKAFYFQQACDAFDALSKSFDRIVLEGAGSCAEVNLMDNDIVNFAMAEYANADVILAADIHRGGVFGQIVGTLECLPQKYRDRVKGIIINRFRGDIALFQDGADWIEKKTGKTVLGVLPWYTHFKIDAEDSVEIEACHNFNHFDHQKPAIGVIRLPLIANFTDFHALSHVKDIQTLFFDDPRHLDKFKAVIIPGSKNTRSDLEWLKKKFGRTLQHYLSDGGHLLGICGGYQMLGNTVDDPHGLEGSPGQTDGLGLLPVHTTLMAPKTTTISDFVWDDARGKGYEIHMGSTRRDNASPLVSVTRRNAIACSDTDGAHAAQGRVLGTYLHGFFDSAQVLLKWLKLLGISTNNPVIDMNVIKETDYDLLKRHFKNHIDIDPLL
jgi:adenosylcobyric acid synthase